MPEARAEGKAKAKARAKAKAKARAKAKEKGEIVLGLDGSQRCQGDTADGISKGKNAGTTRRESAQAHTHTLPIPGRRMS
jgi:hypothetical protein